MNTAVGIIERRVNGLGVSEAEVQTQGDDNIIVNIPKGTNSKQAREQVGTTAQLYFRPVLDVAGGGRDAQRHRRAPPRSASGKPSADGQRQGDGRGSAAVEGHARRPAPPPRAARSPTP